MTGAASRVARKTRWTTNGIGRGTGGSPTQTSLFVEEVRPHLRPVNDPRPPAVHASAGDTESGAAELVAPRAGGLRAQVLDAIAASTDGLTDWEIHEELGCLLYTAAPRRGELLRDGWVRDSGGRRPTPSGAAAVVWVLTDGARRQLGGSR